MKIHPTAIIDRQATIDPSVVIGPYAVITGAVTLSPDVIIGPFTHIRGDTLIGAGTIIDSHASIGGEPQDKKTVHAASRLRIGKNNRIREYVTINRGAETTNIGDDNWLMAYSHVAHDCSIGNNCTFSNGATLGGHVSVGNGVTFGGLSAVHQWCRIGAGAMIAGGSMVVQDVPPHCIAQGDRARLVGINRVGLRRRDIETNHIDALHAAFKMAFTSKHAIRAAVTLGQNQISPDSHETLREFWNFFQNSNRGYCKGRTTS